MSTVLQIFLIICLLVFLIVIIRFLTKKRLNIKYALVWLFADISMLIITAFPNVIDYISKIIGIAAPVNTIFLFAGMFSLLIILVLTMIVSHMSNRIYTLTQKQALLEKRVRDVEERKI